ncbi:MAG: hypothetical protein ACRCUH_10215 [Shewanella sp.]
MAISRNTDRDADIRNEYAEALKARLAAESFYPRMIEKYKISYDRVKQIVLAKPKGDV